MTKWYESPNVDNGVVISSRIRLARNLRKYPFPGILANDAEAARLVAGEITGAVINGKTPMGKDFREIILDGSDPAYELSLLERHCVSPEFIKKGGKKTLLLDRGETVSIMINEEDHARIQTIFPGDNFNDGFFVAEKIDDLIESGVEYAFDRDYGYLTACPTNTGTGLRASYMLNLPALETTGQLGGMLGAIGKFGMVVRGIYGEGSGSLGSIYQISNQMTMGKSENEIIAALKSVTAKIIEQENGVREKLFADKNGVLEDRVCRAYGILKHARRLNQKEAAACLSDIRIGFISCALKEKKPAKTIYNIMMDMQPGSLQLKAGRPLTEPELDFARAEAAREAMS